MAVHGPYPMSMCHVSLYVAGLSSGDVFCRTLSNDAVSPGSTLVALGNRCTEIVFSPRKFKCFSSSLGLRNPIDLWRLSRDNTTLAGSALFTVSTGATGGKISVVDLDVPVILTCV